MEAPALKKRAPNFSVQDCLLLAQLMGSIHPDFNDINLNYHKVDKHRINNRINSGTKKEVWKQIESKFSASSSMPRDALVLQKKWDNLVAKHRNLYNDYMRARSLTGRGPPGMPMPSVLTEAVMAAIGKDCVSVVGVSGASFDTTLLLNQQMEQSLVNDATTTPFQIEALPLFDEHFSGSDLVLTSPDTSIPVQRKTDGKCCCCCCCPQMKELKRRKLELQIKIFRKKN